jgi:3-phenylpropionate/trans-cinnamate dioxygenase ferredoxin subunit
VTDVELGRIEEFPERSVRVVSTGRGEIGVVRWHGQFFALRNICPHEGAGLCEGTVRPRISAAGVGQLLADEDAPVVTCPWHGWEFDARTGQSVFGDPQCRVRTYPVRTERGSVVVEV